MRPFAIAMLLLVSTGLGSGCQPPGPAEPLPSEPPTLIVDLDNGLGDYNLDDFKPWLSPHRKLHYLIRRPYDRPRPVWIVRVPIRLAEPETYTPYIVARVEPADWDEGLQPHELTVHGLQVEVDTAPGALADRPGGGEPTRLGRRWWPYKLDPVTVPAGKHHLVLTAGAHAEHHPNISLDALILLPEGAEFDIDDYRRSRGWIE